MEAYARVWRRGLIVAVSILALSCAAPKKSATIRYEKQGAQKLLSVATSEPLASQAAEEILKKGGNIADAAVASSFAISVLRPHSTGIGGGGFLVFVPSKNSKALRSKVGAEAWDFREVAGHRASPGMYLLQDRLEAKASVYGPLATGVPGLVAGLFEFHRRHGRIKWAETLGPAIRLAENGFAVSPELAAVIARQRLHLSRDPEMAKHFLPKGRPLRTGEVLFQKDLGQTLRRIARDGRHDFYRGETARKVSDWIQAQGGILTLRDFARYRVREREALMGTWRGYRVVTMPPPSSGGVHLLQLLQITDGLIRSKGSFDSDSQTNLKILEIESFKRVYADRAQHLGDPDYHWIPVKELLNRKYLQSRVSEILKRAPTPSKEIKAWSSEHPETTHLSFMDSEGNALATTQTINTYFGASVMVPGTGIILNNEMDDFSIRPGQPNSFGLIGGMANEVRARKRPLSSMTPTIVLDQQDRPVLAIGAPGGSRIITSVYVGLTRFLRDGKSPEAAISDCRFHHQWVPDKVFMEPSCDQISALSKRYAVEESAEFGQLNMVGRDSQGRFFAVSDPRGPGIGAIYKKN